MARRCKGLVGVLTLLACGVPSEAPQHYSAGPQHLRLLRQRAACGAEKVGIWTTKGEGQGTIRIWLAGSALFRTLHCSALRLCKVAGLPAASALPELGLGRVLAWPGWGEAARGPQPLYKSAQHQRDS